MFILDFGSGNTCKNNEEYTKKMIDELVKIDEERKFTIKWQLFEEDGKNISLHKGIFDFAYNYAKDLGYKTTASVFSKKDLDFLLTYEIPFVKIANRKDLYPLMGEIPRRFQIIFSSGNYSDMNHEIRRYAGGLFGLCCISSYPALKEEYEKTFPKEYLNLSISDHTKNWDLFKEYDPMFYECHYKLEDSTGLDAGDFARTPEQIKEIYEKIKKY